MYTVLVIDDDKDLLNLMRMMLERQGYQTLMAANGSEGLELFYQQLPDAVIVDDLMPGMSGEDGCLTIKNDPNVAHIPVIVSSARSAAREPGYIASIGADAVLLKPFHPKDVYAMLSDLLQLDVS